MSTTEGKAEFSDERAAGRARYIRDWALEELRRDPTIELVVAGHAHLPVVEESAPGRYYANSGDWIFRQSYLELSPGGGAPVLRNWNG